MTPPKVADVGAYASETGGVGKPKNGVSEEEADRIINDVKARRAAYGRLETSVVKVGNSESDQGEMALEIYNIWTRSQLTATRKKRNS